MTSLWQQRQAAADTPIDWALSRLAAVVLAGMVTFLSTQASAQFSFDFFGGSDEESSSEVSDEVGDAPSGVFANNVALVESIERAPGSGVAFMDTVQPDQVIELGTTGVLVLSYFESCVRETIYGGRVVVGRARSAVAGGRVDSTIVDCQGATPVITADLGEAGAAVKRVTPFDPEDWQEWTVQTRQPIFKWWPEAASGPATVTVVYLDSPRLKIVWQSQTADAFFAYPASAPPLEIGMPYLVQVQKPDGALLSAVFSIDPWLDVADTAANRIVPLDR